MHTMKASLISLLAAAMLLPAGGAYAQADIGAAASIVNTVNGERPGTAPRRLAVGDRVYQSEVIATAADGRGQLLFRDETALTVGPDSRVTLDRFVYNPGGQSAVSLNTGKGVFRFVSGKLPSNSYNIQTPAGTIGVRGTIFDWVSLDVLVLQLVKGELTFQTLTGQSVVLRNIGDVLEIGRDGRFTISTKLTDGQRAQLSVVRDLTTARDLLSPNRGLVRDVIRRTNTGPSGGSGGPGGPVGGGPGTPGDGG